MGVFDVESEEAAAGADRRAARDLDEKVSRGVRNPDVPWEPGADALPGAVATGGLVTGGGAAPDPGADIDLQNLIHSIGWRSIGVETAPSAANVRSIGYDINGNFLVWLPHSADKLEVHAGTGGRNNPVRDFVNIIEHGIEGGGADHAKIMFTDGVLIDKSLKFDKSVNTTPGNEDRGIGYSDDDDAFIKTPTYGKMHYQAGGRTAFTAHPDGISLPYPSRAAPWRGGDIRQDANNYLTFQTGGRIVKFTGTGTRGWETVTRPGVRLPVLEVENPTTTQLDTTFAIHRGSVGLAGPPIGTRGTTSRPIRASQYSLWVHSNSPRAAAGGWFKFLFDDIVGIDTPSEVPVTFVNIQGYNFLTADWPSSIPSHVVNRPTSFQNASVPRGMRFGIVTGSGNGIAYYKDPVGTLGTDPPDDQGAGLPIDSIPTVAAPVSTTRDLNIAFGPELGSMGFSPADRKLYAKVNDRWVSMDLTRRVF